jgi:hypothetical protein
MRQQLRFALAAAQPSKEASMSGRGILALGLALIALLLTFVKYSDHS